ncbi:transporter [Latilactobacillus curvatus]|uniref:lipopolysaccharide biosynthesis protein n=1 Tax=Latilactobacillus curvatus TaxID=28038 RepID=UPI0020C8003F|nr:transporter [Latilactobacillus curvatus]MCP8850485.1 transporter [Latilactobacillus curvatus]
MMNNSRLKNSVLNSIVSSSVQVLNIVLKFIVQTVFIHQLGAEYLGINGLFVNILSILSFAELGIGTAITFSLYKPLAVHDENGIAAVMNFFKKAYNLIGLFVAVLGIIIIPLLPYLIKNTAISMSNIQIIYLLYLTNSVVSYFFTYKRSLLIADQKGYISVFNQLIFSVIQIVFQVIALIYLRSYLTYLLIQILCTILSNVFISFKVNKTYSYLAKYKNTKITKNEAAVIKKNTIGMMGSKVGGIVVSSTDNLIISGFVGVFWVGLYSNYFLIVNSVGLVLTQLVTSISSSIGNLIVLEKDDKKKEDIYFQHNYINLILILFSASLLMTLLNPFIKVWIGDKYLLSTFTVVTIVVNFIVTQIRQTAITFITSFGLFSKIGVKSIFEALFNLIFSLTYVLIFKLGVSGVLLGTISSNILINVWYEPYIVYKFGFNRKIEKKYFIHLFGYLTVILLNMLTSFYLTSKLPQTFIFLIIRALISCILSLVFMMIFLIHTQAFIQLRDRLMRIIRK